MSKKTLLIPIPWKKRQNLLPRNPCQNRWNPKTSNRLYFFWFWPKYYRYYFWRKSKKSPKKRGFQRRPKFYQRKNFKRFSQNFLSKKKFFKFFKKSKISRRKAKSLSIHLLRNVCFWVEAFDNFFGFWDFWEILRFFRKWPKILKLRRVEKIVSTPNVWIDLVGIESPSFKTNFKIDNFDQFLPRRRKSGKIDRINWDENFQSFEFLGRFCDPLGYRAWFIGKFQNLKRVQNGAFLTGSEIPANKYP